MKGTDTIRGVLLDIDGVLHVGMQPVAGATEALTWLAGNGYRVAFVTNTTTMKRSTLAERLQAIGLPVEEDAIVTAPVATASYIRATYPDKRCWVISKGDTTDDFAGIPLTEEDAEVVVIGGAEELLSYETMNKAFRLLMKGAPLLAMHKNLYWRTTEGLQLDSGPFVYALEQATGKQAVVLGKPDRAFFEQALHSLGVEASEALMLGDDVVNDVAGAQKAGIRGVLVCTGKYSAGTALPEHIQPDAILPSIADLPALLQP
ncbi:HAD superfamily hydrolase (TIGR01458 family) [Thermosporothrix hazakensis]|jgi:HAD superfamily hydrolase (TIGR01458 family)|uniref:Haloacid dehalogenase-like hydrolase domain-containing protein 2 n=1 Tax=Thermosporothrix hazakensis TaxID=644383 RepID=A0A326U8J4_THEHA|nr:TIGR01458 family HAD-type hydrolase [Thermosporothrix hazakensis]PZW30486.1 HAD superfamily hydrolase (TIGR01458 family) [Thermosporothrix hazakensis]GCE49346.1 haloacid dehalogenase [Thermosporothrix hazakensis]